MTDLVLPGVPFPLEPSGSPAVQVIDLHLLRFAKGFQFDKTVNVSLGSAIDAVFLDQSRVFKNIFSIQHGDYPILKYL